jgi:hypothetical protein
MEASAHPAPIEEAPAPATPEPLKPPAPFVSLRRGQCKFVVNMPRGRCMAVIFAIDVGQPSRTIARSNVLTDRQEKPRSSRSGVIKFN